MGKVNNKKIQTWTRKKIKPKQANKFFVAKLPQHIAPGWRFHLHNKKIWIFYLHLSYSDKRETFGILRVKIPLRVLSLISLTLTSGPGNISMTLARSHSKGGKSKVPNDCIWYLDGFHSFWFKYSTVPCFPKSLFDLITPFPWIQTIFGKRSYIFFTKGVKLWKSFGSFESNLYCLKKHTMIENWE